MRIYLIGYMYCGKTTVGHRLADSLGYEFVDLDQLFEARYHTAIPLFFQRWGEGAFRKLEQQVLHATEAMDGTVIATGGGTPCYFDNMDWINAHGLSIYLDADMDLILSRAAASKKTRPILAHKTPEERQAFIQSQLSQRLPYYRKASLSVAASHPDIDALVRRMGL